ncbi:McrC family protein [Microtetraspora malaysiensis]|uniref:McrC family protein n=1 Tax=Microtetraspora malaysiensis TaxID=161358 RepID=UPI000836B7BF|nr:hypothetical protein [Microtetraspora malaysiensis]
MIDLVEGGPARDFTLSPDQVAALLASKAVRITPGPRSGLWRVRDNGYVGAATIGGVAVRIKPKTPIDRVLFLFGYSRSLRGWRQEEIDVGEQPDFLPALAHAFARVAERALRQGVLQGYRTLEDSLQFVRGRIREADQVRRRYGLALPVEVRYDEFTVDVAENQLLLAATARLLRQPGLTVATRRLLRHVLSRLTGVSALVPGRPLPQWRTSRLNARYHTTLRLAELVLRGSSYKLDDGTAVRVDGLLIEMWRVFEDFVTVALSEAFLPYGGRSALQDRKHHLDHGRQVPLRPDLVRYVIGANGTEQPTAVVDAKYKISTGPGGHNDDLYQALAYCTVLGLPSGHLIYAKGDSEPHRHVIHRAEIEIIQHALDLTLPPSELLDSVGRLARSIIRYGADHELVPADPR